MQRDEPTPIFSGGTNIRLTVPSAKFEDTVRLYRDTLRMPQWRRDKDCVVFDFGGFRLWIEHDPNAEQTATRLEILTDDLERAKAFFEGADLDDLTLSNGGKGRHGFSLNSSVGISHWITSGSDY